jgi:tetratricopeptide (TPR) repeat protein
LHDAGVHLFFRAAGATLWQDAGAIRRAGRHATIGLPLSSDAPLELRLVTADLAGNRSVSETVRLDPRPAPAAPQDASTANATLVEQPRPVSVAKNVADADQTTAPPPAPPLSEIASQLQKRADAFLAEGRYGLAEARLRDALAQMPDHPDLLLDLGQVLYRQERFDDAGTNFANVLNQQPENLDATEWMAIVAQTQRRYPEAREHLQRLLDHQPEAGIFWLRYGDVEHRLGRVADAIKAWERALGAEQADAETRAKAERRLRQIAPLAEVQLSAR